MAEKDFNKHFLAALESDIISKRFCNLVQQAMAPHFKEIDVKFKELNETVSALRKDVDARDTVIADLRGKCHILEKANDQQQSQLVEQDSLHRRDNLIFTGLKLAAADVVGNSLDSSRVTEQVLKLCSDCLGCAVQPSDISCAYPIGKQPAAGFGSNKDRPVLVKFVRRGIRDNVYAAKSMLKAHNQATGEKIFINEDLPQPLRKLSADLRQMVKEKRLQGTWSSGNKVYVKKLDGSVVAVKSVNECH